MPLWSARFAGLDPSERKARLADPHPQYELHAQTWQVLLDAYEGSGGFLDGGYLWAYPAELAQDYQRRQEMARYHNYAKTLINLYVRHLFGKGITRTTTDPRLEQWWADVDGHGLPIEAVMRRLVKLALATGHAGALVDRTPDAPVGPSRRDERAHTVLRLYPATAIRDWRLKGDALLAVKLAEALEVEDLLTEVDEATIRYLLWDATAWARLSEDGEILEEGEPALGRVPLSVLRAETRADDPFLGQPLLGNANVYRALFNRASEEDEVLRTQAFSTFTVEVGEDADVEAVKNQIGPSLGTARALVVRGATKYNTPDQAVPGAIRENIAYLVTEVYRAAHVRWQRDSADAESAEAIRLQHAELNEVLQGLGAEAARVEREIARHFFAWQEPTPEAADAAFERADVSVSYPREFFLADLAAELTKWADAVALNLGETAEREIKKQAVRQLLPDLPVEVQATIDQEIEHLPAGAASTARDLRAATGDRLRALMAEPPAPAGPPPAGLS